jgi:hypothetical protein
MKKLILLILLIPTLGSSQARLGSTRSQIYTEFAEVIPTFSTNSDGMEYLVVNLDKIMVLHYFNEMAVCTTSVIYPETQGALNNLVELYNNRYVIISPRSWRMYSSEGSYADVTLVTNNQITFFVWE